MAADAPSDTASDVTHDRTDGELALSRSISAEAGAYAIDSIHSCVQCTRGNGQFIKVSVLLMRVSRCRGRCSRI